MGMLRCTLYAAALVFASCSSTATTNRPFRIAASAQEVVVATEASTDEPRQVLVEASVIRDAETLTLPRVIVVEGLPAQVFVGDVETEDGTSVESGVSLEILVEGPHAKIDAKERDSGTVTCWKHLTVPIQSPKSCDR